MRRGRSSSSVTTLELLHLPKESRFHKRTKHIKRRFNSIRDQVKEGDIDICKIHMDLNVADPLTKPLSRAKHDQHQDSMGVDSLQSHSDVN